jgi:hypothetical protein
MSAGEPSGLLQQSERGVGGSNWADERDRTPRPQGAEKGCGSSPRSTQTPYTGFGELPVTSHNPLSTKNVRRRPTLPHPPECSTIGAEGLSYRVRNGTGRFPNAMTAVTPRDNTSPQHPTTTGRTLRDCFPRTTQWTRTHANNKHCVDKSSAISTSQLHMLPCFHIWPINPVISWGPPTRKSVRISHLEAGFPLRCFQRLSLPDVANQPCPWQNNWHTRGQSIPVLSY